MNAGGQAQKSSHDIKIKNKKNSLCVQVKKKSMQGIEPVTAELDGADSLQ